jgi:hypothetical protein
MKMAASVSAAAAKRNIEVENLPAAASAAIRRGRRGGNQRAAMLMASPVTAKRQNGMAGRIRRRRQRQLAAGAEAAWLCKSILTRPGGAALNEGESENRQHQRKRVSGGSGIWRNWQAARRGETAGGSGSVKAIISQQHRAASKAAAAANFGAGAAAASMARASAAAWRSGAGGNCGSENNGRQHQ